MIMLLVMTGYTVAGLIAWAVMYRYMWRNALKWGEDIDSVDRGELMEMSACGGALWPVVVVVVVGLVVFRSLSNVVKAVASPPEVRMRDRDRRDLREVDP